MDFLELAKKRYSCRKFTTEEVEQEKIDKIIEAAMAAPTAINSQPFKIWVITSKEDIGKVGQVTPYTFGAPLIFAVGAKKGIAFNRKFDGKNFCEIDASIVATHMMLEIYDLGLGTTWVGHFNPIELKMLFPQMSDYEIVALFPVGYPANDSRPSPMHDMTKSKESLVVEL